MKNDHDFDAKKHEDDSFAYARSLEKAAKNITPEDPLTAVKDMRLQQLAACRIKTAKELQDKMAKTEDDK
jgi:hypothetical protein